MNDQKTDIIKANKILKETGNDLLRKYGAKGYAVGYKVKDGSITEDVAIIFYVDKKKNKDELSDENLADIPKEIDGIPTDVIVMSKGFEPR